MNLDPLKKKLADTCAHLDSVKDQKKAMAAGFSEEIKGAEKKIKALYRAINEGDLTLLSDAYDPDQVESLLAAVNAG